MLEAPIANRTKSFGLRITDQQGITLTLCHVYIDIDSSVVVPLEVPRTEMVSLQLLVDLHRNSGIQKQQRKPGQAPGETIGKKVSENGVDLGILGGVDLAWIFFGTGKKGLKKSTPNPRQFSEQNPRRFSRKSAPKSVPQKSKNPRRAPTLVPSVLARSGVLSSRTERPLANALSLWRKGRMN